VKNAASWKPGKSGNPRGRKPGTGEVAKLRKEIAEHIPDIVTQLVTKAKAGDVGAARLLLERVLPAVKPVEAAAPVALPEDGTLTDKGAAVLAAVAAGDLAPGQGAALLAALGTLAKVAEVDELQRRIEALEDRTK
jgi:hypothetical protein